MHALFCMLNVITIFIASRRIIILIMPPPPQQSAFKSVRTYIRRNVVYLRDKQIVKCLSSAALGLRCGFRLCMMMMIIFVHVHARARERRKTRPVRPLKTCTYACTQFPCTHNPTEKSVRPVLWCLCHSDTHLVFVYVHFLFYGLSSTLSVSSSVHGGTMQYARVRTMHMHT